MSDYIFPYWDGLEYWNKKTEKDNKTLDDDDIQGTTED